MTLEDAKALAVEIKKAAQMRPTRRYMSAAMEDQVPLAFHCLLRRIEQLEGQNALLNEGIIGCGEMIAAFEARTERGLWPKQG